MNVDLSELRKISHIDVENLSGRFISTLTFYDEGEWELWLPSELGLIKAKGWPAESFYFAKTPEKVTDIYLHFLDFLAQRASFPTIAKPLTGLKDDFFNLSASLAKLDHLFKTREQVGHGISRMVATEIEYIFGVCRSVFDLLQEVINSLWSSIKLLDETIKKNKLPDTFSKMIGEQPPNAEQLSAKYGLPLQLAEFYLRNAEFFLSLKRLRDNFVHHGSSVKTIFSTEKGFAVSEELMPFASYNVWSEEHKLPNGLCSLRPAIGYVIHQTIVACEDFSSCIEKVIQFPPPVAPEMHFFMRGYFNEHLISNVEAIENCHWWDVAAEHESQSNVQESCVKLEDNAGH